VVAATSRKSNVTSVVPATSQAATEPVIVDDNPLKVLARISGALHSGDQEALRRCIVLGDDDSSKLFDASVRRQVARIRLTNALKRAGITGANVSANLMPVENIMDAVAAMLDPASVQINGDSAVLPFRVPSFMINNDDSWENGQLLFMRVDGTW